MLLGRYYQESTMNSQSGFPVAISPPLAQLRCVSTWRRLNVTKLQDHEHDALRATYQRMLERGPQRFLQVKPRAFPDMAVLYEMLPNSPKLTT
jgi:ATP-dependent Lon protease